MKLFSPYAVLLILILSNTAMWGQGRTVKFSLGHSQEVDYCLTGNKSEFSLTIETKLDIKDSLQAYTVIIDFDPTKVKITSAQRLNSISAIIPESNFDKRSLDPGQYYVSGFVDLSGKGFLTGTGSLFYVRGEWLDPNCPDTTACKISLFEPGFEFGISPRTVIIDSMVTFTNRVNNTTESNMEIESKNEIIDSIPYYYISKDFTANSTVIIGKAAGNNGIYIKPKHEGDSISSISVSVSDVKNLTYQILPSKEVLVKKITNGSEGSLSINFQIKMPVLKDTARTTLKIYSESEPCDCIMTHDTSVTELVLYQIKKKDTSVNAEEELQKTEQETCIDFFDIMGRFIETNCSSEQMVAPNVRKKKAIKIGNNLIKYID